MGQAPFPDDADSGSPGEHSRPGHLAEEQTVPLQFSLSTLLAVVAAYALLFGLLRWLGLQSVSAFAAIVIYVTAIALTLWSPLAGQDGYLTLFLLSGILSIAGVLAISLGSAQGIRHALEEALAAVPVAWAFGCFFGWLLEFAILILGMIGALSHRLFGFPRRGWPCRSRAPFVRKRAWTLRARLAILALLVILFSFAVFMIPVEQWFTASRNL